jgi:hypothetical protein
VREAAGKNHRVGAVQIGVFVPDELGLLADDVRGGVERVVIRIRSGKDDDREFHCRTSTR